MVHKGKDFKFPVSYSDSRRSEIHLYVQLYVQLEQEGQFKPGIDLQVLKFQNLLTHVNLSVTEDDKLVLDHQDLQELKAVVHSMTTPKPSVRRRSEQMR